MAQKRIWGSKAGRYTSCIEEKLIPHAIFFSRCSAAWIGCSIAREECGDVADSYTEEKASRCTTAPAVCGGAGQRTQWMVPKQ